MRGPSIREATDSSAGGRLDEARIHARQKILDRLIQQATDELSDPAMFDSLEVDLDAHVAKLSPGVRDAVKHRLLDRVAGEVAEHMASGEAFEGIVDEATRRAEEHLGRIRDEVVSRVSARMVDAAMERLSDVSAMADTVMEGVDPESDSLRQVDRAVSERIEARIVEKALGALEPADKTAEDIESRIPGDDRAVGEAVRLVHDRILEDTARKAADVYGDPEALASRAMKKLDPDSDAVERVRELLAERLLMMVMGDALEDLGRRLTSSGPRDPLLDRAFQSLGDTPVPATETAPAAHSVPATEPESGSETVSVPEPEPAPIPEDDDDVTDFKYDARYAEPVDSADSADSDTFVPTDAMEGAADDAADADTFEPADAMEEAADEPVDREDVNEIEYGASESEPVADASGGPATGSADASTSGTSSYVYGVLSGSDWPKDDFKLPDGVEEGSGVRTLTYGNLLAVVSDVPSATYGKKGRGNQSADWKKNRLRRHARVLGEIGHRATVIPLPFGMVYDSDSSVLDMLVRKEAVLKGALERLGGRVEWTVRVVRDDYRMLERMVEILDADGMEMSSLPEDVTGELDEALASSDDPGKMMAIVTAQCGLHARAHLELFADGSVDRQASGEGRDDNTVLNRAYLVPRDAAKEFRKGLETLASQWSSLGVSFEVSGPWPPYHFAEGAFDS